MPGPKETRPHDDGGRASHSLLAGYHSDGHSDDTDPAVESPTLEDLASFAAGLTFPNDLVRVVHERSEARDRATQRRRRHARDALQRTPAPRLTADETQVQRESAMLYARLIRLTKTGKIRWDEHASTWVERPTVRPTRHRPAVYTEDEILAHFERVRRTGKRWTARCPAHDDRTPSLAIAEGTKGWLLKCWAGCDFTEILHAVGLEPSRMFNR